MARLPARFPQAYGGTPGAKQSVLHGAIKLSLGKKKHVLVRPN